MKKLRKYVKKLLIKLINKLVKFTISYEKKG